MRHAWSAHVDWRGGRSWAGHIWAGGGDLRAQAGRGWTDPVRGGETPLESRSRLVGAQLSLPRGGKKGGRPEITHHHTITLTDEYSRQGVG